MLIGKFSKNVIVLKNSLVLEWTNQEEVTQRQKITASVRNKLWWSLRIFIVGEIYQRNLEKEEWNHSFKSRSLFFFLARSKRERRLVGLARKSHYSPNFRATTVLSVFNLFWGSAIIQSDTPMKIAEAEPRTLDFLIPTLKTDAKHHHCWQLQFTKGLACESNSLHTPQWRKPHPLWIWRNMPSSTFGPKWSVFFLCTSGWSVSHSTDCNSCLPSKSDCSESKNFELM